MLKKIILPLLLALSLNAQAQMTVKHYVEFRSDGEFPGWFRSYIVGLGDGILAMRSRVIQKLGGKSAADGFVYCPPTSIALNFENMMEVLDDELKVFDYPNEIFLALVLVRGYERTFPCDS